MHRKIDDQYKHLLLPFQPPLEEATGIIAKADFEFRPTKDDISNVKAPRRRSVDSLMIKQDLKDTRKNFYDLKMQVSSNLRSNDQL